MWKNYTYLLPVLLLLLASCLPQKNKIDWRISLDEDDKKPYGAYLSYQLLQRCYPNKKIVSLSPQFRYTVIDQKMRSNPEGPVLLLAVGMDFLLTDAELDQLRNFADQGNEIVVLASNFDRKIKDWLQIATVDNGMEQLPLSDLYDGSENLAAISIKGSNRTFGYQGRSLSGFFRMEDIEKPDSTEDDITKPSDYDLDKPAKPEAETLGHRKEQPNMLRYAVGKGHITLHSAPLVMSNYFLLQEENRDYLQHLWQLLPENIAQIYWHSFFKRTTTSSDLGVLLQYAATRWALLLAVFALVVYVLFESKRRQRIIPEIAPPENTSASFVETVGRLYYNKGNHQNLAEKMTQHFLEWARSRFHLNTTTLNDNFAQQLSAKSGMPEATAYSLVFLMHDIQSKKITVTESDLYHLHHTIQQFHKIGKK